MTSTVRETEALDLLETLRGTNTDLKIEKIIAVKANIKHQMVQNEAIGPLFEACRLGIASSNNSLFSHAYSCLGHLIKRVSLQDPTKLRPQLKHTVPLLLEKMGDSKERTRSTAIGSLLEFWKAFPAELDKIIKDSAFVSRNPKIREGCLILIVRRYREERGAFAIRPYKQFMVQLLEDSDASVRDTAKQVVIELFKDASDHAKSDLKKELTDQMVRATIAKSIISQLGIPGDTEGGGRSQSRTESHEGAQKATHKASATAPSSSYLASLPGYEMEELESEYVNTARELDSIFQSMLPAFDGRESEQNWAAREKNITKIRQLLRGNGLRDFPQNFLAGIKLLQDGILKGMTSLRTTLSCNGMQLVKDLAMFAGSGIDPMVELLLSTLIKLCAGTKKITAQTGFAATATLLANASYSPKILHHIWLASQDKNVQPREYASGWIRVILEAHIDHKGYMEHSGGVDYFEKCIRKGVTDANPKVRENMRVTYWKFAAIWPERAAALLATLEGPNKTLLEKANPNSHTVAPTKSSRSAPAVPTRSSLKETIMAQKRQLAKADSQAALMPPPSLPSQAAASSRPTRPMIRSRPGTGMGSYTDAARAASPALVKPSPRGNGVRSPVQTSPPQLRTVRSTPIRQQSPAINRQATLVEQLNHPEPRVRIEALVSTAALLSRKTSPNQSEGQVTPALPPADILANCLLKSLEDEHQGVIERVLAPELLPELVNVVPIEQLITKILILNGSEEGESASKLACASLSALKKMLSDEEAAESLYSVITAIGVSAVVPRKLANTGLSSREKKKVLSGCLSWMNDLLQKVLNGTPNRYFEDLANYRQCVNRFISMLSKLREPLYSAVADILLKCEKIDSGTFDKITYTHDPQAIRDLKAAWGIESEILTEKPVHHVLSEAPRSRILPPNSSFPSSPTSPHKKSIIEGPTSTDEDLTMIQPLSALRSIPGISPSTFATEDKENKQAPSPIKLSAMHPTMVNDPLVQVAVVSAADPDGDQPIVKEESISTPSKSVASAVRSLQSLISRIKTREIDTMQFRKLIALARENPVRVETASVISEDRNDIWQDGKSFNELMSSLLEYLRDNAVNHDANKTADLHAQAILVIRQLLSRATPYFAKHESSVLITLIEIRGNYSSISNVTTGIVETCEDITKVADPSTAIPRIVDFLSQAEKIPTQSKSMALQCLGDFIRGAKPSSLEQFLSRIGPTAIKCLEDPDADVRRACTTAIVELHVKLNNDRRLFEEVLKGVGVGQQNLLVYYFAKKDAELKK